MYVLDLIFVDDMLFAKILKITSHENLYKYGMPSNAYWLSNSYNMGKRDLPDIYVCPSPRAAGPRAWAYISNCPCYK